ncbi:MAG: enoyl-CoA hydratase/isomerase family protein [Mycobacteriaceae bacterium]
MEELVEDESAILFSLDSSGVARMVLNRPDVSNAINADMAQQIKKAVEEIDRNESVRCLVISSSGSRFCAGGDISEIANADNRSQYLTELVAPLHCALGTLSQLSVPVVALVQGVTAGAGLGLVLAADLVISAESAKFLSAYAGVGFSPDCGVSALLPKVVGLRRALELMMTERVLSSAEACEWGLVSQVVPDKELSACSDELIGRLLQASFPGLGHTRRLLRAHTERGYFEHLHDERLTLMQTANSSEASVRISRFMVKNKML